MIPLAPVGRCIVAITTASAIDEVVAYPLTVRLLVIAVCMLTWLNMTTVAMDLCAALCVLGGIFKHSTQKVAQRLGSSTANAT